MLSQGWERAWLKPEYYQFEDPLSVPFLGTMTYSALLVNGMNRRELSGVGRLTMDVAVIFLGSLHTIVAQHKANLQNKWDVHGNVAS